MNTPKVSVIIPVYNAEQYIEKCVRSLFEQTINEIEYIFVDDCSPDNSIRVMQKVLDEYPYRKQQVKIIRNKNNIGVGQTRQKGIDLASGEYIIHCDPDDWVERNMYEKMYIKASSTDADIVICNYINEFSNRSEAIYQKIPELQSDIFKDITEHKIHTSLCNKLIRSELVKITPIEIGIDLWEDMSVVTIHMLLSNKTLSIEDTLYHYNLQNCESITQTLTYKRKISKLNAIVSLSKRIKEYKLYNTIDNRDLYKIQWDVKRFLLDNPSKHNIKLWNNIMPDGICHYSELELPLKSKILTWLAINKKTTVINVLNIILKIYNNR